MRTDTDADKAVLMAAFARLDTVGMAIAMGSVLAMTLFAATAFLLLKGAPEGADIGTHLGLIGIYLPGYSVSWSGALVGAAYIWVIGAVLGFFLSVLWNMTHYLYVAMIVIKTAWVNLLAD